ncbi:MAG: DKNYY domain-containing protein [Candidatus Peregrinibacteria bacterium]|nr:DKNYY domain-containing protein [Candidatus Peregrinibacteria bacterium]
MHTRKLSFFALIIAICLIPGITLASSENTKAALLKRIGPNAQELTSIAEIGLDFYSQKGKISILTTKYGANKDGSTWSQTRLKKLLSSDAASFQKISSTLYADKNALYYAKNERGKLDYVRNTKIKNPVTILRKYKSYTDMWNILESNNHLFWSVDGKNFYELKGFNSKEYGEIGATDNVIIFKDKKSVYYGMIQKSYGYDMSDVIVEQIKDADPETFTMLSAENAQDKNATYYFGTTQKEIEKGFYELFRNKPVRTII